MSLFVENQTIRIIGYCTFISIYVSDNGILQIREYVRTPEYTITGTGGSTDVSGSGVLEISDLYTDSGIYDEFGVPIFLGFLLERVLEMSPEKYARLFIPTIDKEYLQILGDKNRLYYIEGSGIGSASLSLTTIYNSSSTIAGRKGFFSTRLIPNMPVVFLNTTLLDTAIKPFELGINIYAVERVTGSSILIV